MHGGVTAGVTTMSNDSSSLIAQHTNRRRVILAMGSTAVGGGILARAASQPAAAVSVDSLEVPDAEFEAEAVEPELEATVAYEYSVPSATDVTVWLGVGDDRLSSTDLFTSSPEASNDVSLSAALLDSSAFEAADFEVGVGESTTVDVPVTVGVDVYDGDSVVAKADASETAVVTVQHPDEETATASVGGTVTIVREN